jgi:hypothetical protein
VDAELAAEEYQRYLEDEVKATKIAELETESTELTK